MGVLIFMLPPNNPSMLSVRHLGNPSVSHMKISNLTMVLSESDN